MRLASINKKYYCGIDLHAKNIMVCVQSKSGKVILHEEIPSKMDLLIKLLKRYLNDIAIGCESTFNWYWLADGCRKHRIPFYLGHALYMKHIHGGKTKNDWIDSKKIADLLRSNMLPLAYDYPKEMRTTRDLLRRRRRLVELRTGLYQHVKMYMYQQGINDFPPQATYNKTKRKYLISGLKNPDAVMTLHTDLELVDRLDRLIMGIENQVKKQAKYHDRKSLALLRTIDGAGPMLSLTVLYETHHIHRFKTAQRYSSYSRVVVIDRTSAGKSYRGKNKKIGNPHLRWTYGQIACLSLKYYPEIKKHHEKIKKRHGNKKAMSRLAHKFCVTIYYMLRNNEPFDVKKFVSC
jgi:transposase